MGRGGRGGRLINPEFKIRVQHLALLMRGYDLYLLAIAKLLNSNYSRWLSFYFHTLIQQRPTFKMKQSSSGLFHLK